MRLGWFQKCVLRANSRVWAPKCVFSRRHTQNASRDAPKYALHARPRAKCTPGSAPTNPPRSEGVPIMRVAHKFTFEMRTVGLQTYVFHVISRAKWVPGDPTICFALKFSVQNGPRWVHMGVLHVAICAPGGSKHTFCTCMCKMSPGGFQ